MPNSRFALHGLATPNFAIPPTSYRGLSAPLGASVPQSVPESVPENGGVRRSVPLGVPRAFGPWAPERPKTVPSVSPETPF